MRNERGITMVALIIMIILMLVMVSAGVFTGIDAYHTMEAQTFIAQMKVIKEKIYVIREEYRAWDNYLGDNIYDYIKEEYTITKKDAAGNTEIVYEPKELALYNIEIQKKFESNIAETNIKGLDDTNLNNYFYFTADDLDTAFGLANLDVNVFINFQTGTFISEQPVNATNFAGKVGTYYVLDELLAAQSGNFGSDVGDVTTITQEQLRTEKVYLLKNTQDTTKVNIKLNKIFDKSNTSTDTIAVINAAKPEVKTPITNKDKINLNELDKTNIELEIDTTFVGMISFEVKIGEETVTTPSIEIEKVNDPLLVSDAGIASQIKKVGWDESYQEYLVTDDVDWYDYGISSKKWANIKMPDDSYYVWIPRFAYCIDGDEIDIKFLKGTSTETFDGINVKTDSKYSTRYNIPQAFSKFNSSNSDDIKYKAGEYDTELPGIWVSKYECTVEKIQDDNLQGCYLKSKPFMDITKNSEVKYTDLLGYSRRMVGFLDKYGFKDVVYPTERNELVSLIDMDSAPKSAADLPANYPEIILKIDTHLIKNSEWAALSYLSYSSYGSNGNPINSNLNYTAGEKDNFYESSIGTSSTANAYGVFDLTNNRPEFVSTAVSEVTSTGTLSISMSTPWLTIYSDKLENNTVGYGDGMNELKGKWINVSKQEYFNIDSATGKKEVNKNILTRGGKALFDYEAHNYNETTKEGKFGVRMVWIMK